MDPKDLPGGGPAFPTESEGQTGNTTWRFEGMTLRDYFAGKALPAAYADAMRTEAWSHDDQWRMSLAKDAYATADAMLRARAA